MDKGDQEKDAVSASFLAMALGLLCCHHVCQFLLVRHCHLAHVASLLATVTALPKGLPGIKHIHQNETIPNPVRAVKKKMHLDKHAYTH